MKPLVAITCRQWLTSVLATPSEVARTLLGAAVQLSSAMPVCRCSASQLGAVRQGNVTVRSSVKLALFGLYLIVLPLAFFASLLRAHTSLAPCELLGERRWLVRNRWLPGLWPAVLETPALGV